MTGDSRDDGGLEGGDGAYAGALSRATTRLRRDPLLLVPFTLAGLALALVDRLRLRDPVPTRFAEGISEGSLRVEFVVYPTGTPETVLPYGALVDLHAPYLAWSLGLEAVALLALSVAGWYTIARAMGTGLTPGRLGSYAGFVALLYLTLRLLDSFGEFDSQGFFGLLLALAFLGGVLFVFARLFVAPALVVAGEDPLRALVRSVRVTRGHGLGLLMLVLLFGVSAWLLGSVSQVGAVLSTAIVAPVHAVSTVTVLENATDGKGSIE